MYQKNNWREIFRHWVKKLTIENQNNIWIRLNPRHDCNLFYNIHFVINSWNDNKMNRETTNSCKYLKHDCNLLGCLSTGSPSSSCEMIILRNNSYRRIIRVCMGIFTTALRNKKIRQILNKNTSSYFHSVSLAIWRLTLMKRAHYSELFISRFSTYIKFLCNK